MSRKYDFKYHIAPPKGLLNDPNGLVQFRGQYHVFYQWNQEGTTHANKSWGHLVSDDMVHWKTLPVALEPTDWFDKNGVYSGSALVFEDELYLFYTGNVKDEEGTRFTYQCLATSKDGVSFEKHGPLFTYPEGYTAHVRDPKVWRDAEKGLWYMVLGAQKEDLTGDTILYASKNLRDWEFRGSLFQFDEPLGYMWECPDLIHLDGQAVFIFSPQGLEPEGYEYHNIFQTTYVVGEFANERFKPETQKITEMDRGFEFYAPQTFQTDDGRTVLYAWMGTMPPEMEESMPTVAEGWIHHLSVPRELSFVDGKLYHYPVKELEMLRQNQEEWTVDGPSQFDLMSRASDILVDLEEKQSFSLSLFDEVELAYDQKTQVFSAERTNWHSQEREVRHCYLGAEGVKNLRILVEASSLEIFINDGQEVFSLRYFAAEEKLTVSANLKGRITSFTMDK